MTTRNNQDGFTLIELMVAMATASILMVAISTTYQSQVKSYLTQQKVLEMQQNARAAMFIMEREIMMAGYDPTRTAGAGITPNKKQIIFTILADDNGIDDGINNDGDGLTDEAGELKTINYSLVDQQLLRTVDAQAPQPVAQNIERLNFVYLDGDRVVTNVAADIRSVQITLIARSGSDVSPLTMKHTDHKTYENQQGEALLDDPDDMFRRIVLSAEVQCRNLGI